jgi:putative hemolysin
MPAHDFKELLNLGQLPGEERGSYLTLGGFVMMQMGGIPVATDSFEAVGLRFEVANMDGKRVDKVAVRPLPSSESGKSEEQEPGWPS